MKKILVTGGAGYIGSICVEELINRGFEVSVFDNLTEGHAKAVDPRADFYQGDLADRSVLQHAFGEVKPDAVMHFAANALVGESMVNPSKYFRNNVSSGINLLDMAVEFGVKKFVFSSTCATFGIPERMPIDESLPQRPINPYGESKLMFESHLIPNILKVALGQRESVDIFGTDYPTPDGTCIRDYIHILDLAEAHILAVQSDKSDFYNLGTGGGTSVREVIETCKKITGRDIKAVEKPRRAGDPPRLIAASEKIRAELGWTPRFQNIVPIVESAWAWHVKHPNGYGD